MSALPIEFEILIPLVIALFFSGIYELDRKENLWSGIVAMGVWLVSAMVYLLVSNYPTIALVFMAAGIIYLLRIMIALLSKPKEGRMLT